MKKIISLLLSLVMVMGLAVGASAASITINPNVPSDGTSAGETYTAYKIFDATFSDEDLEEGDLTEDTPVSYTIKNTNPFYETIENSGYFTLTAINESGVFNVEKKDNFTSEEAATLVTKLKEVIDSDDSITGISGTGNVINVAEKGYYLITSTLGSKMIVDTLGDITIETKNQYPSLSKVIVDGNSEVTSITADRGEPITFKITVNIPETVNDNIIIHDTMDADLTYKALDNTAGVSEIDSCGVEDCGDSLHFEIDYDAVGKGTDNNVSFTYTATLNADAATVTAHTNVANLTYSAFTSTDTEVVSVYTYEFDVYKWTGEANNGLAGAGFKLKNTDGNYYTNTDGVVSWTDNGTEYVTSAEKEFTEKFAGIAAGTYTLEESKVPDGYNKANDITVVIGDDGSVSIKTTENETVPDEDKKIEVENKTGSELPSTGGIGTTLFYVIGGLLMVGAVVVMVTKKRIS